MAQDYSSNPKIEIVKKLAYVLGHDFTAKSCKVKTRDGYIHKEIHNVTTMRLYNHLVHDKTFSLPIHNPTFSNLLIFDINNNQPGGMPIERTIDQVKSDFEFFYREEKTNGKGAHLYCYCDTPIHENAKRYLVKHYKAKGMLVETEWDYLRLPYSSDYRGGATDQNDQPIVSLEHLLAVFETKDSFPMKVPAFLKPFNQHGPVAQKYKNHNSSGISTDELIISRGERVEAMKVLGYYAIGENMSLEEYANLCDSKEDSSNPSRGLHCKDRDKIILSLYNWAADHYDKKFQREQNTNKIKKFLNNSELPLSNENFDHIDFILRRGNYLSDIKSSKVKEKTIHDVQNMMEGILSMQDHHETNPSGEYKGKFAVLNNGLAIAQSTVKLIAEDYGIKNWKRIWKIVKEVFLEPIALANGYFYSYCNIRHAIHYKISSIVSLFNSLIKKLYSKKSSIVHSIYYNICRQVSCNINSPFTKIMKVNSQQLRAGPL